MKILVSEKLSPHKYKTPEGYLICTDAILARTGKQTYKRSEVFGVDCKDADSDIEIDRDEKEVFSETTLASFENKPITIEHPDEDVNPENYKDYTVGFVRDVHKGMYNGQPVMLGTLVIHDVTAIEGIEDGLHTDLSCGYDCDIIDEANPQQRNIRGNHVALCSQGRAGIARIVDSIEDSYYTSNQKQDKEFVQNAVKEMNRYINNWSFMSAQEKRNIGCSLSELKARVKELQSINDSIKDTELVEGKTYTAKSGAKLTIKKLNCGYSDYSGEPNITIEYDYVSASGNNKGSSKCNSKDFFEMMTNKSMTGDSIQDAYMNIPKKYEKDARDFGLSIEKGNYSEKIIRVWGPKYKLEKFKSQYDADESISYIQIVDSTKDSINDELNKAIEKLKSAKIPLGDTFEYAQPNVTVQIQHTGKDEYVDIFKYKHVRPKTSSYAWGRVWVNGKMTLNISNSLIVVIDNMIKHLQSLKSSVKDTIANNKDVDTEHYVVGKNNVWFAKPKNQTDLFDVAYASYDNGKTWHTCYKELKSANGGTKTQAGKTVFRTSSSFPGPRTSIGRNVLTWYANNNIHNVDYTYDIDHIDNNYRNDRLSNLQRLRPVDNLAKMRLFKYGDSNDVYKIVNNKGHYEVYKNNKFLESCDTKSEAEAAIKEDMEKSNMKGKDMYTSKTDKVYKVCNQYNYYTHGDRIAYENLLNNADSMDLNSIAYDIWKHSNVNIKLEDIKNNLIKAGIRDSKSKQKKFVISSKDSNIVVYAKSLEDAIKVFNKFKDSLDDSKLIEDNRKGFLKSEIDKEWKEVKARGEDRYDGKLSSYDWAKKKMSEIRPKFNIGDTVKSIFPGYVAKVTDRQFSPKAALKQSFNFCWKYELQIVNPMTTKYKKDDIVDFFVNEYELEKTSAKDSLKSFEIKDEAYKIVKTAYGYKVIDVKTGETIADADTLEEAKKDLQTVLKQVDNSIKDDRLSPMTYKKLKELGVRPEQWKKWTQEQANNYIANRSKKETSEKESSNKEETSKNTSKETKDFLKQINSASNIIDILDLEDELEELYDNISKEEFKYLDDKLEERRIQLEMSVEKESSNKEETSKNTSKETSKNTSKETKDPSFAKKFDLRYINFSSDRNIWGKSSEGYNGIVSLKRIPKLKAEAEKMGYEIATSPINHKEDLVFVYKKSN